MRIGKKINLIFQILGGISLVAASAGIVLGISAATFSIDYIDLNTMEVNQKYNKLSYRDATPAESKWNCNQTNQPTDNKNWIETLPNLPFVSRQDRYKYSCEVLDGSTHQVLDKSFNQSIYNGLVNFIEDKIVPANQLANPNFINVENSGQAYRPTSDDTNGFSSIYNTAAKAGYKVLNTPGFMHVNPILSLVDGHFDNGRTKFKDPIFNNTGFILIDGNIPEVENVASVMFRTDEAAFFAGIATCCYLAQNYQEYAKDGPLAAATYGGINIPTVTIAMGGFQRGIQFWNSIIAPSYGKELSLLNPNTTWEDFQVKFIDLGSQESFFTGSFVAGEALGISQQLLNRGADAIFPVAGPQTIDTITAISNQKSSSIVIGVDTIVESSDIQKKSVYTDTQKNNDIVKFSATKNMANITEIILNLATQQQNSNTTNEPDELASDLVYSFGYLTSANSFNGGVSISKAGWSYVFDAFIHTNDHISSGVSFKTAWDATNSGISFDEAKDAEYVEKLDEAEYLNMYDILSRAVGNELTFKESDGSSEIKIFDWIKNNMFFIY